MASYLLRRVLGIIPLVFVVLVVVFFALRLIPGDPVTAMLPPDATQAQIDRQRAIYGLDQPMIVQFGKWLGQILHLDLGNSIRFGQSVTSMIGERFPATVELAVVAGIFALLFGVVLGVIASVNRGRLPDRVASVVGLFGISLPNFWIGLVLIIYVAVPTGWFPTGSRTSTAQAFQGSSGFYVLDTLVHGNIAALGDVLSHLALPGLTLGAQMTGFIVRMTRSSMLDVLGEDYIRTARAKGANEFVVTMNHGLRNASRPIVTVFGLELAGLLSGSIIVETIFSWPGIGNMLITAVNARDYPLIEGTVLVYALIFIVINLFVDITYRLLDPRIRY